MSGEQISVSLVGLSPERSWLAPEDGGHGTILHQSEGNPIAPDYRLTNASIVAVEKSGGSGVLLCTLAVCACSVSRDRQGCHHRTLVFSEADQDQPLWPKSENLNLGSPLCPCRGKREQEACQASLVKIPSPRCLLPGHLILWLLSAVMLWGQPGCLVQRMVCNLLIACPRAVDSHFSLQVLGFEALMQDSWTCHEAPWGKSASPPLSSIPLTFILWWYMPRFSFNSLPLEDLSQSVQSLCWWDDEYGRLLSAHMLGVSCHTVASLFSLRGMET